MPFKVLLYDDFPDEVLGRLRDENIVAVRGTQPTEENICREIVDCDAILALRSPENGYNQTVMDAGKKLKLIARFGVGYDTVDVDYATKQGIYVTNTPGVNCTSVAEATVMLMLECARNAQKNAERFRTHKNRYAFFNSNLNCRGFELKGKTLGLVGCGNIGRTVGGIAHAGFGMNVIGFDPYLTGDISYIARKETMEEVFTQADMVSLHLPATPQTVRSIGMRQFSLMKPGAYLINTSRGNIVREEELIDALQRGIIRGAGLDVFANEPVTERSFPLFELEQVALTPHNAASTTESYRNIRDSVFDSIIEAGRGQIPANRVNDPANSRLAAMAKE